MSTHTCVTMETGYLPCFSVVLSGTYPQGPENTQIKGNFKMSLLMSMQSNHSIQSRVELAYGFGKYSYQDIEQC